MKKYPASLLIDERETDIHLQVKNLNDFINKFINFKLNYADIINLFYNNTPQAFVEAINQDEDSETKN